MAWASLVITAGPAAAEALASWSPRPRTMATLLLWGAWTAVLLAVFVPRPLGLTVLRVATPHGFLLSLAAAPWVGGGEAALAVAATALCTGLCLSPSVGAHFVNGAAYGSERRFPLRVPPALLLGPIPLAGLIFGAGAVAGPLLLADGRLLAGAAALIAGMPAVAIAARSLYALSQRWAVLVPAGIVLKDPLTLVDPVLFPRDRIASLRPLPFPADPAEDVLDLRLGAAAGSLLLELTDNAQLLRARGRARPGELVKTRRLTFSPRDSEAVMAEATRRRTAAG